MCSVFLTAHAAKNVSFSMQLNFTKMHTKLYVSCFGHMCIPTCVFLAQLPQVLHLVQQRALSFMNTARLISYWSVLSYIWQSSKELIITMQHKKAFFTNLKEQHSKTKLQCSEKKHHSSLKPVWQEQVFKCSRNRSI